MQKILVGLICTLALLAYLMPATIAEDSQNATANITINETQNVTASITLNETQSAAASVTEAANPDDSLKSTPAVAQLGSGNAATHTVPSGRIRETQATK